MSLWVAGTILLAITLVLAEAVHAEEKIIGYTRVTDSSSTRDKIKKWIKKPFSKEKSVSSPYIKQSN